MTDALKQARDALARLMAVVSGYGEGAVSAMSDARAAIAAADAALSAQPEPVNERMRNVLLRWTEAFRDSSKSLTSVEFDRLVRDALAAQPVAAPAQPEPTRSQQMREAGFAARDTRIPCDECGALCTPQLLPAHKCAQPVAAPAQPVSECADNDSPWLVCKPCSAAGRCARAAVTDDMVAVYRRPTDAYWKRVDGEPTKLGKWRNGTPSEATRVSLAAALAAQPVAAPAQPVAGEQDALSRDQIKDLVRRETGHPAGDSLVGLAQIESFVRRVKRAARGAA